MFQKYIPHLKSLFLTTASFLTPIRIEEREGEMTKRIRVELFYGKYHLDARGVNYSWWGLYEVFRNVLQKKQFKKYQFEKILVLGLGGWDIVKLIRNEYKKDSPIIWVEGDKVILELGEKYFGLATVPNLERIHSEAIEFLKSSNEKFDCIIIDLFVDSDVPPQFHTEEFARLVKSRTKEHSLVLFNKMLYKKSIRAEMDSVENAFRSVFPKVERVKTKAYGVENNVLWCDTITK